MKINQVTIENCKRTARLVGHAVYLRSKHKSYLLGDTAPAGPHYRIDPDGRVQEVK